MKPKFLFKTMLLLCAIVGGVNSAWATLPQNPQWVATSLSNISDNATIIILSNSDIALPSTTTNTNPSKKSCEKSTSNGITTIKPPTGTSLQDLAWTLKKVTENNSTSYKFYQEGSTTVRLYLNGTNSNTALRVGDTNSSNDQFVLGDLGKLLKVTTATRYVGPYNSGSDWRTYNTENASNYNSALLTFYVLQTSTPTPTISAEPTTLNTFTYVEGSGPSAAQTISVSGANLTENISLALDENSNYEMCLTENGTYTNSLTLTQSDGTVSATNVYVRLRSGLEKGTYEGTLTIHTDGIADDIEVSLSGSVTGQTYAIEQYTTPATAHGTITFSPSSPVATGVEVTLTATPDEGYTFTTDSWVIYKQSGEDFVVDNSITVTDNQFTMPAYAVYVDGTFTAIAVTGVTLNKSTASIGVGDTETLTATVAPSNALNKAVTWTSNNTGVATVDNGIVTGVAVGSATITATTTDGSFTATCTVTVENVVTFTAGTDKGSTTSNNSADEVSKSGVTISSTDAALATAEYRLYSGSTNTISVTSGKITKIEFTKNGSYNLSNLSKTTGSAGTYESSTGVWTGVASSVAFTASAQVRLDKIKVFVANTATPTFNVAEGTYDVAQNVIISCTTDGASIYYTDDGTTPTSSSTEYTSAIHITETTTLKAIAIKDGVESDVASATYTMNRPAAPTFDVEGGIFNAAFTLHLSADDGATIYYTTNGDTPTSSSTVYSDGISIPAATTTVKAIAVKSGLTSDVTIVTYTYDTRPAPTFTLSATELNLKVNETSSAVSLTTNSDGEVTFSCDNAAVTLTGTGNSRTISANAAGEYTVNVATAATENYLAGAGTITVTVTKKAPTMVLTPTFTSKDLYVTKAGSLTGVPQYNSADVAGAEVTYTSSNTSVATIASDGAVTFKKAGTTTLTASYAGNDEYEECEATYELDLVDTTPQSTEVDITFGNALYDTSYTGTNAAGNGPFEGTVNNVTVTVAQGSGANLYVTDSETRIYGGTTKGTITISAPTGYVMTKIVITKGSNWSVTASPGTLSTATWTGEASSVVFSASARSDFKSAVVTLAPTVSFGTNGYTTYASPHALDLTTENLPEGVTAYKAAVSGTTVIFTALNQTVPANTGVLLKGEASATVGIPVAASGTDVTENEFLVNADGTTFTGDNDYYYFAMIKNSLTFGVFNPNTLAFPANKAYLKVLKSSLEGPNPASRLMVVFNDGETTGIKSMDNGHFLNESSGISERTIDNAVYDLQGRRVDTPRKGSLYIVNGKKVVF